MFNEYHPKFVKKLDKQANMCGAFSYKNAPLLLEVVSNHTNNKEAHYEYR